MKAIDRAANNSAAGTDDPRVVRALEEYIAAVEAGGRPNRQEFQARYPDISAPLAECLDGLEFVQAAAPQLAHPAAVQPPGTASEADFWPADALGDYRIVREIGRGGMGVVYEVIQVSLGRRVALKVLPFATALDGKQLQRFKNEAQAAAQLHHQNIVPVYGVGCERGVHYYAMQFIDGQTLSALIAELRSLAGIGRQHGVPAALATASLAADMVTGRWADGLVRPPHGEASESVEERNKFRSTPSTAETAHRQTVAVTENSTKSRAFFRTIAHLGVQAAAALEYAHALGIVHRDVKPANLLLDSRGNLWVTDFGLAHCQSQAGLTMTGDLMGTLRYMSPEQALGQRSMLDHRTDIYSLGATLYELLTLEPVFDGRDRQELLRQIAGEEPRRPRGLNKAIPAELETIVLKAMEKSPPDRYATAQQLADDLGRYLKDEPIRARPVTLAQKVKKWTRRHRGVAWTALAMLSVLVVAVAVVASLAAWRLNGEREATRHQLGLTQRAEADTKDKLWGSYLAQARAGRLTRRPGQRFGSLRALQEALKLPLPKDRSLDDLRAEAIASLCVTDDLEVFKQWDGRPECDYAWLVDDAFERYARSDNQGHVSVRRIADDRELFCLRGEGIPLHGHGDLDFSPDGRFLHEICHDPKGDRGRLWRIDAVQAENVLEDDHINLAFRPDGRWFAAGYPDGSVRLYDPEKPREVIRCFTNLPPQLEAGLRFNPRLPQLAIRSQTGCRVIDVDSGETQAELSLPAACSCVDWHPDGRIIAMGCDDMKIYLYEVDGRRLIMPPLEGHKNFGIVLRFNHAGDRLVSNDWSGILRLWDTRTGRQVLAQPAFGAFLAFSRDDRLLAADLSASRVHLFRCHTSHEFRTVVGRTAFGESYKGHAVWARDSRLLALWATHRVALVDTLRGEEVAILPLSGIDHPLYFEPHDEALWTSGQHGVLRWPIESDASGRKLRVGPPQTLVAPTGICAAATSADGQLVCIPNFYDGAVLWRRSTNTKTVLGPQDDVRKAAISPDGRWVATGSHNLQTGAGAKVWDAETGRHIVDLPVRGLCWVRFSPDCRWLVTTGGRPRIWAADDWQEGADLGSTAPTGDVCFTADSQLLALEGDFGEVRLIRTETGEELARLTAPEQTRLVPQVFTPDGTRLVTLGTETGALYIFDLSSIRSQLVELGLDWDAPPLPPSPATNVERLEIEVDLGDYFQADAAGWRARGERLIGSGETVKAAEAIRHAFDLAHDDVLLGRWWASLLLESGDRAGFRRACARLREVFGESKTTIHSGHLSWTLLLAPDAVPDMEFLTKLAQNGVAQQSAAPWVHSALAGAELRNGRYESALRSLNESDRLAANWDSRIVNDILRAMALVHLGRVAEARPMLESASRYCDAHLKSTPGAPFGDLTRGSWQDWYPIQILLREAEALLRAADAAETAASPAP